MASEKIISINSFEGGINTDVADELLPSNMVREAWNVEYLASGEGQVGVIRNVKGNILIQTPLPTGTNITIGRKADEENNKFYWLNYNSGGYHTIYQYNALENRVTVILQSITDSGGIDILRFDKDDLILHIDIVDDNLLSWSHYRNPARKINIEKCIDKSDAGYGEVIKEEFINAAKLPPAFPPVASYFTDNARVSNFLYGKLFKAAYRFLYDDGEKSNWSDWGNVPVPLDEPSSGQDSVPATNNGIKLLLNTGSEIVEKIEIAIKINNLDFVLVGTLDKKKLTIGSGSTYEFSFYNDGTYSPVDQEKIIRPFSYLPKCPAGQAFVQNAMVYVGGKEGFDPVDVDMSVGVTYEDLFLGEDVENELNKPVFMRTEFVWSWGRTAGLGGHRTRWALHEFLIGPDVKDGNTFRLMWRNYYFAYTAKQHDDARSVAGELIKLLQASGRIWNPGEPIDTEGKYQPVDIGISGIDTDGSVRFKFIFWVRHREIDQPAKFVPMVNPVSFNSLKDRGTAVRVIKAGSSIKYGIVYEDGEGGRKSATYTADTLVTPTMTITERGKFDRPIHTVSINHLPPVWAKYYQIVRTADLIHGSYIYLLVQKVSAVETTPEGQYLDLVVGSLDTFKRMHPNTVVDFAFAKNDRVRLVSKYNDGSGEWDFYTSYETVVLKYDENLVEKKNAIVSCDGTTNVKVGDLAIESAVGKYINVDGHEREIVSLVDGETYQVSARFPFGSSSDPEEFASYELIDRRGILRVRKPPAAYADEIVDTSIIEVFKPSLLADEISEKVFFEFGKKFGILNAGTDDRVHQGAERDQNTTTGDPAVVKISEGTAYIKNREMPITNNIPGTQTVFSKVEDSNFSDFYESDLTDNGRSNIEDDGTGEVRFGSRFRYSNNYIEGTKINGLNDFDNTDREDYNDPYGDVKLIVYREKRLYVFKELKTGWIPVYESILRETSGQEVVGISNKLLNGVTYYNWEGGIGDNPESFAQNGHWIYFVSPNSGIFARIGGDGITPISETYHIDSKAREILQNAARYSAKILGGFDRSKGIYVISIPDYDEYIYNGQFEENDWTLYSPNLSEDSDIEILESPEHGDVAASGDPGQVIYTPDEGYVGEDSFTYRVKPPGGEWSEEKRICLKIENDPFRQKAWRPKGDGECVTEVYWGNDEQSQQFTKDDCPAGSYGTTVPYTVVADTYFSDISQADADQKALDDIAANGQAYANAQGTCEAEETAWEGINKTCELTNEMSLTGLNTPDGILHTMPTDRIFVSAWGSNTVEVFYGSTLQKFGSIPLAGHPRMAVRIDGDNVMLISEDGHIKIINAHTNQVKASNTIPIGYTLGGFSVYAWGGDVAVLGQDSGDVYRINKTTAAAQLWDGTSFANLTYGENVPGSASLVVLGTKDGEVKLYNPVSKNVLSTTELPNASNDCFTTGLSWKEDGADKYLFALNQNGRTVAKFGLNGSSFSLLKSRTLVSKLNRAFYKASSDTLYLSEDPDKMYRLDPETLDTYEVVVFDGFIRSTVIAPDTNPTRPDRIYIGDYGYPIQSNPGTTIAILEKGNKTGNGVWIDLEEYYVSTGEPTGNIKPNVADDPDYIPPFPDPECGSGGGGVLVGNDARAQIFFRNNCGATGEGSEVDYIVYAETHFAPTKEEANQMAVSDIWLNGQDYANTHGTCGYENAEKSQSFAKNDCGTLGAGTTHTYVVPAGTYSSDISQADADQKALDDIVANGQNYANTQGTCEWVNSKQSQEFQKNDCGTGEGSTVIYTVPAGTYSSSVSLQDANDQALADIAANGQNYANTQGTCGWENEEQSQEFQKNDCDPGEEGSTITYTVPAGTYTSIISQQDADNQALADIAANGQANANALGSCEAAQSWGNVEMSQSFTKDDCGEDGEGSIATYTVPAGTYTSIISQQDANDQAAADIAANGQAYANSIGTCETAIWYNEEQSDQFTRNNCSATEDGSTVPYTVPAGTYSSVVSQADANSQALADILANGQAYANSIGTCTTVLWYNAEKSKEFRKNNCGTGLGELVVYTVPAETYSSEISQADADQKAQNDITLNGQAYANANGICGWWNEKQESEFTRDDCGGGSSPDPVLYTVPEGTYYSTISQADANQKAIDDIDDNGQAYANVNGVCVWTSDSVSDVFVRNNCSDGKEGNSVTYTLPSGMFVSTVSKEDANTKAIAHLEDTGQDYANMHGTCTWYNSEKSKDYFRQDCGPETHAARTTYVVPARKYSSQISKLDADQQADWDVLTNGQQYANDFGQCLEDCDDVITATFSQSYPTPEDIVTVEVFPDGGEAPYTFLWDNGQTTKIATGIEAFTEHWIDIADSRGCSTREYFTPTCHNFLSEWAEMIIEADGEDFAKATIVPSSTSVGPYTYEWSTGDTTDSVVGLVRNAEYSVIVTDTYNGCQWIKTFVPNTEVLTGLSIETMYFSRKDDPMAVDEPYADRLGTGGHNCNYARYRVFANGVEIGTVTINNAGPPGDNENRPPGYPYYSNPHEADRYSKIEIDGATASSVANADGTVAITLTYAGPSNTSPHASPCWLRIKNIHGEIILSTTLDSFSGYPFDPYTDR